jgi:hypothetical protein
MILERLPNFERALDRRLWAVAKDQGHPIAGGQSNQFAFCFRGTELLAPRDNIIQLADSFALIVYEEFGVADDIDKQHVPDLQFWIRGRGKSHRLCKKNTKMPAPRPDWNSKSRLVNRERAGSR